MYIDIEVRIHQSSLYVLYMLKCCVYSCVVPGMVNITDITCEAVNLINLCSVGWNVSV